ncbi:hypothetical protein FTV88_0694 [Heliorestis convoluta]|uniref:Response regulator n=2 Tax=Heliorestis convoluta TaxID=356322 RepID=A0A5Q2N0R6_9FIRM|nr:hypothetical protein FTV88_0694 [Heliorestis convoluta]
MLDNKKNRRALIVSKDKVFAHLLCIVVSEYGLQGDIKNNVTSALKLPNINNYCLVIVELGREPRDYLNLLKEMKKAIGNTSLWLITPFGEVEDNLRQIKVNKVFSRSVDIDELNRHLSLLLTSECKCGVRGDKSQPIRGVL